MVNSQEWYLMTPNTRPNATGGFENDAFLDYKEDSFVETLQTDIGTDVVVYNYDMSESLEIRAIIQGNTADTQLKSMERSILVIIGTLHSGDYVFFEDEYWIVDGRPSNNGIYEKATMKECQYKLRWQKEDGTVVDRWANVTSASKYDVGEDGNNVILLKSNNYTIIIPSDEDSMTVEDKRVFIDRSSIPKKVFKITRNDDVLFIHGSHGGTLNLIADRDEFNKNTDNQELWICDYIAPIPTPLPPLQDIVAKIISKGELRIGFSRTYTATLSDSDSNDIAWDDSLYSWNIVSDFEINQSITENKIKLLVDDDSLIGESFLLQVIKLDDNSVIGENEITVCDVI